MPCKIRLKKDNPIYGLLQKEEFNSLSEIADLVVSTIGTGKKAIFKDEQGKPVTLNVQAILGGFKTVMVDGEQRLLSSLIEWADVEHIIEIDDSATRFQAESHNVPSSTKVIDKVPSPNNSPDYNKNIKFSLLTTTTNEADGEVLDNTDLKKKQRIVLDKIYQNPNDYQLVMMEDVDGIKKDSDFTEDMRGQVILVVKKGINVTKDNILEVAEKVQDEVIPIYFEAPLTSDLSNNSFFGKRPDEDNSRTEGTHVRRLDSMVEKSEGKLTHKQAQAILEAEFHKNQKLRKQEFTVLNLDSVSEGFRVENTKTFGELSNTNREYSDINLSIDKEGNLYGTITVDNISIDLEAYGTKLSKKEIELLGDNVVAYNKGEAKAIQIFNIVLGTDRKRHHTNTFQGNNGLQFNDGETSSKITTKEQLLETLKKFPYRNRSKELTKNDVDFEYLNGSTMRQYFFEHFYPSERLFKIKGDLVPDVANRYVTFSEKTNLSKLREPSLETQVSDAVDSNLSTIVSSKVTALRVELQEGEIINIKDKKFIVLDNVSSINGYKKATLVKYAKELGINIKNKTVPQLLVDIKKQAINGYYDGETIYYTETSKLEEEIHSLTARWIRENPDSKEFKDLTVLREQAIELYKGKDKAILHSLSSNEEFLARGLSHNGTIDFLTKNAPTSWFDKLSILIKDILSKYGITAPNNVYAELLGIYDTIVHQPIITSQKSLKEVIEKPVKLTIKDTGLPLYDKYTDKEIVSIVFNGVEEEAPDLVNDIFGEPGYESWLVTYRDGSTVTLLSETIDDREEQDVHDYYHSIRKILKEREKNNTNKKIKDGVVDIYEEADSDLGNTTNRPFSYGNQSFYNIQQAIEWSKTQGDFFNVYAIDPSDTITTPDINRKKITELEKKILKETDGTFIDEIIGGGIGVDFDINMWRNSYSKIVQNIIIASFKQNPSALKVLLDTGDSKLIHTGLYQDNYSESLMIVRGRLRKSNTDTVKESELDSIKDTKSFKDRLNRVKDEDDNFDPLFSVPDYEPKTSTEQVEIARSLDSLLVIGFDEAGYSLRHLKDNGWKFADVYDAFRPSLESMDSKFSNEFFNNEAEYLSIWQRFTRIFERTENFNLEDAHVEAKEEGFQGKEWDRKGNENASIKLIGNNIRSIYDTLPTNKVDKNQAIELANGVDVHYTLMDAMDGLTDLRDKIKALDKLPGAEFQGIYSNGVLVAKGLKQRLGISYDNFDEDVRQADTSTRALISEFYTAVHTPSLPFKVQVEILGEDGEVQRIEFIQKTGSNKETVLGIAYKNFQRLVYKNTELREIKNSTAVTTKVYKEEIDKAINEGDWKRFTELLGLNIKLNPNVIRQLSNLKPQLLTNTKFIEGKQDPLGFMLTTKNNQSRVLNMLIDIAGIGIKKSRMALGPDGQPVAAETLPNTITQMVEVYNNHNGYENLDHRSGFLKTPRFRNSLSYDRIFKNRDKVHVIAYGGKELDGQDGSTSDLNTQEWIGMNITTLLNNGYMEMMRTESSSSAWAFKVGDNKLWAHDRKAFLNAFKGYYRGELETIRLNRQGLNSYKGNGLVYFSFIKDENLINDILNSPESVDDLLDRTWDKVEIEVKDFLAEQERQVSEHLVDNGVQLPSVFRKAYPDYIHKFAMNYLITNIEESFLFNHSVDYYKNFHKRAKAKVSTGHTPIPDAIFWETMPTEGTISNLLEFDHKFSPILNTFNAKDDVISYVQPLSREKDENGRLIIDGNTIEFDKIFDPLFESKVNHLIQTLKVKPQFRKNGKVNYQHKSYIPYFNDAAEKVVKAYSEMEVGDGAGYISMDHYRALQQSVGNWPQEAENHYQWEVLYYKQEILGKPLNEEETKFFRKASNRYYMSSSKWSYFGPEVDKGHPIFDKFSLIPLVPSVVHNTQQEHMIHLMARTNTAYYKNDSGTKVAKGAKGEYAPMSNVNLIGEDRSALYDRESGVYSDLLVELGAKSYQVDVIFFKEQLKTNNKPKTSNIFGSQFRKLVFSDLMQYGIPRDFIPTNKKEYEEFMSKVRDKMSKVSFTKLPEVEKFKLIEKHWENNKDTPMYNRFNRYKKLVGRLTDIATDELLFSLGASISLNGSIQIEDFGKFINTLEKKSLDNTDVIKEFLAMNRTSGNTLNIPFEATSARQSFDKLITGLVKKEIVRQKAPGGQLIQVPSTGFVSDDFKIPTDYSKGATGLRSYQMKDGKVLPAEAKISIHGEFTKLLKRRDVITLARKEGIKYHQALNRLIKEPKWREDNKELITITAYRIPTQGLSSMEVFEITEFLPSTAGKTIITPIEIVAKAGSDYDIDKLSVVFPNITEDGEYFKSFEGEYNNELVKSLYIKRKELQEAKKELVEEFPGLIEELNSIGNAELDGRDTSRAKERIYARMKENTIKVKELKVLLSFDSDINKQLLEQSKNKQGEKAQIQNEILTVLKEQILDSSNFHQLTMPLTTFNIRDLLEANGEQWFGEIGDPQLSEIIRFDKNVAKRTALLMGKQLLGIAAVANTFNQLYQQGNIEINKDTPLNLLTREEIKSITSGNIMNISSHLTFDNILKSELFNQFVNATVDAANEDYLGYANFSKETMAVVMWQLAVGVPPARIFHLLNTESVRNYVSKKSQGEMESVLRGHKFVDRKVDPKSKIHERLIDGALKAIGIEGDPIESLQILGKTDHRALRLLNVIDTVMSEDYANNKAQVNVDSDLTTLGEHTSKHKDDNSIKSFEYYMANIDALTHFLELKDQANEMFTVSRALNFDTSPVDNPVQAFQYNNALEAAKSTLVSERTINSIRYGSVISSFAVQDTYLQIMQATFPIIYSDMFLRRLADTKVPKNTTKEIFNRVITNDLLDFLIKTRGTRELKGEQVSLGQWAKYQLQNNLDTVLKENPKLKELKFFQDLSVGVAPDGVPFLRLVRDAKDLDYVNIYANDIKIAHEIAPKYTNSVNLIGFLQTGYNRTYYSWSDVIPPSLLSNTLHNLLKKPVSSTELDEFFRIFARNNRQLYSKTDDRGFSIKRTSIKYANEVTKPIEIKQAQKEEQMKVRDLKPIEINGVKLYPSTTINNEIVGITLNNDQLTALQTIADHYDEQINKTYKAPFLLTGKAGTGKTTLVKVIKEYIDKTNRGNEVSIITPTHKAGMVASLKTFGKRGNYRTVASLSNARDAGKYDVLYFDEISMTEDFAVDKINEKTFAAFRLLVGDKAQIPPVKKPRFGNKMVSKYFDTTDAYNLTELVRFSNTGPIAALTNKLSENQHKFVQIEAYNSYENNGEETIRVTNSDEEFIQRMLEEFIQAKAKDDVRIITYSNNSVRKYTDVIRNRLLGHLKGDFDFDITPFKGELLTGNLAWTLSRVKTNPALNSMDYEVKSSEADSTIRVHNFKTNGTKVSIDRLGEKGRFSSNIIILNNSKSEELVKHIAYNMYHALELDIFPRRDRYGSGFDNMLESLEKAGVYTIEPIYAKVKGKKVTILDSIDGSNVVVKPNISFGYALTAHKAQGSTYKSVYLDERNIESIGRKGEVFNRDGTFFSWEKNNIRYVGASRASTNLNILTSKTIINTDIDEKLVENTDVPNLRGIETYTDKITSLNFNQIFAYGTNLQGFHGAGSAGYATFNEVGNVWRKHGYDSLPNGTKGKWNIKGQSEGLMVGTNGKSWGLPTVIRPGAKKSIPLSTIKESVNKMYEYARNNPDIEILVAYSTGKNLNGYTSQELADAFSGNVPSNVVFEENFSKLVSTDVKVQPDDTSTFDLLSVSETYGDPNNDEVKRIQSFKQIEPTIKSFKEYDCT